MALSVAGEMTSQHTHHAQVLPSGQALMQIATFIRATVTESVNVSVDLDQSRTGTLAGPAGSTPSEAQDQHSHSPDRTIGVWDKLENMTLEDLQRARFVAPTDGKMTLYAERAAPVCGVLWFYHIGKCAGSSAYAWLRQLKEIGGIQEVLSLSATPFRWEVDRPAFEAELQKSLESMEGKLVAVHHHHNGPGLYSMGGYFSDLQQRLNKQGCSLVRWTLLREPKPRLISHVNFVMQMYGKQTPDQAAYAHFLRTTLAATNSDNGFNNQYDNHQVRYVLNNFATNETFPMPFGAPNDAALATAMQILDGFEVVGIVEKVNDSISQLTKLLNLPAVPFPRSNVRSQKFQGHDKLPLPNDVDQLIEERIKLERKLYARYDV